MTVGRPLDYGFSTLGEPGIARERIIELSRQNGIADVELRVAAGELLHPGMSFDAAAAIGADLASAGISVLSLSSYVALCGPRDLAADDSAPRPDPDLAWHLELADAVGGAGVRVFMKGDEPDRAIAEIRGAARLRSVAEVSHRTGVRVLIETHDSHPTARSVVRFLDGLDVAPEWVGVIWDTAHSWAAGESPEESLDALGPWLAHLQIKDVATRADPVPVEPGAGVYPVDELADAIANHGWHGGAVLEWERAWHPDLSPLSDALPATRRWAHRLFEPRESDTVTDPRGESS